MKKIAVVLFALAVMCVSGEPPAGKKNASYMLGKIGSLSSDGEKLEVYEDWERGYFVYKQVNYIDNNSEAGDIISVSITAAPIRTDWPPKQSAEKEEGK